MVLTNLKFTLQIHSTILMIRKNIVGSLDFDDVIYRKSEKHRSGHLAIDQFELLEKDYPSIWKGATNVIKSEKNWENLVKGLVEVAGNYEVRYVDYMKTALELVDSEELSPYMRESLKILSPFMTSMNIFSGSGHDAVSMYVAKRVSPLLPETDIRVFGTEMEIVNGIITKNVKKMWNAHDRAEKARELTGDKESIGIGDSKNDLPLVESSSYSFIIT